MRHLDFLKRWAPIVILVVTGMLFSTNLLHRFDLPLHDEALYAKGSYPGHAGWAQLYQLLYFILNGITGSRISSLYLIVFYLTFILLPVTVYFFSRRNGIDRYGSSAITILCLFAEWNYPSFPKIQVFNFVLLLLAVLPRWIPSWNERTKRILSYALLALSLYSRQDNVIVLLCFILWDTAHSLRQRTVVTQVSALAVAGATVLLSFWFFSHPPSTPDRTWFAFRDHFYWRNSELFRPQVHQGRYFGEVIEEFFNKSNSIPQAFLARPDAVKDHFLKNLQDLPEALGRGFNLVLTSDYKGTYQKVIFYILLMVLVFFRDKPPKPVKSSQDPFLPFALGLVSKCLLTAILLQPQTKYIFEINFIGLVWLGKLCSQHIPARFSVQRAPVFLLFPLLLVTQPFQRPVFWSPYPVRDTIYALQNIFHQRPFRKLIGNLGLKEWSQLPYQEVNIWNERRFDHQIRTNLSNFLAAEQVDILVLEDSFRGMLIDLGLWNHFYQLELNPQAFGYIGKRVGVSSTFIYSRL